MSYREARELARIRQELRERLMAQSFDGADDVLARLRIAAGNDVELRSEYERWRLRFDLLAVTGAPRVAA